MKALSDEEMAYTGQEICKNLYWLPVMLEGKELFIKKLQFFTGKHKGLGEVKIDGIWYNSDRKEILKGLKAYNQKKRMKQSKVRDNSSRTDINSK